MDTNANAQERVNSAVFAFLPRLPTVCVCVWVWESEI